MRRHPAILLLVTLALTLPVLPGCEGISFIGQAFKKKTPAVYELADRPTLILVDDPDDQLGDPMWSGTVASNIALHLKKSGTVETIIPQEKLYPIAQRLGEEYYRASADQLGREVGAEQVIRVYVHSAEFNAQPGAYKPSMVAYVKVIDAADRKVLWPKPTAASDETVVARGHPVASELRYKISASDTQRGDAIVAMRKLCERSGRDIAWLFFDHAGRQPGEKFED